MARRMIKGALLIAGLFVFQPSAVAQAVPVELKKTQQGWQLLRDGEPYFIRGAGGSASLAALKAAGGNSVRTWGGDTLKILDEAHALGMTVTVGIWLGHERHGFDYSDTDQVRQQLERAREKVLKLKDHPALLLWGVGNEMEGFAEGDNPLIWRAVNDVAAMIKEVDPHHPTMTVTAYVHGKRIEFLHRQSPAIDIHGINAYGAGAKKVPGLLREGNASKPFVLTEFGPIGAWDSAKSEWGAPYELSSTEKAAAYRDIYDTVVTGSPAMALGSYAFTWGHKMEATETWFGMFLADGSRTGAIDAMTEVWSGRKPENLVPTVEPLTIGGKSVADLMVAPGARIKVSTVATDPENAALTSRWVLKPESAKHVTGGDFQPTPRAIEGAIVEWGLHSATVKLPNEPGAYRLFYFVYDDGGNAATANIPLLVKGQVSSAVRMPFPIYEDRLEHMPWVPSGFMGDVEQLTLDGAHAEQPHQGDAAVKIRYTGKFGWAGVAWQNPANNWGDMPGGFDLSAAGELELWARGEYGGEKVSFGVGLIDADKDYPDSGIKKIDGVVLTHQWKRYTIPIGRLNLSSIKTGFVVVITGRTTAVTIYLDSIRFKR